MIRRVVCLIFYVLLLVQVGNTWSGVSDGNPGSDTKKTVIASSSNTILRNNIITVRSSSIIRPPYLQNVTQAGVDIMWGSSETSGKLFWGSSPGDYTDSVSSVVFADNDGDKVHTATISGLTANDTIYYYVRNGSENIGLNDPSYYAVTALPDDNNLSFRFIAYGDSRPKYGGNPDLEPHARVIEAMIPHDPRIVLHMGDIAREGYVWEFNNFYFVPTAELAKNIPVFPTLGNHELRYDPVWENRNYETDVKNYRDLYSLPSNNSEGIEDYYSFDYGNVHFVSLNTEWLKKGSGYYDSERATEMRVWLENDLNATTKPWKIVFFHKQSYLDFVDAQEWDKIFENNGVDVVFHGHAHNYLAHYRNDVTYVTTGGGGSPLGGPDWWGWSYYRIKAFSDYHFVRVDVTPGKLFLNVFDDANNLRHWIEISSDGDVSYPQLDLVDDFDAYENTETLQGSWSSKYIPTEFEDLGVTFERSLATGGDADTSNVMQLDFSYPTGSEGAWGSVGVSGLWNWSVHNGINFWIKASTTGDSDQNYQLRIFEADSGDKWVATMPVSELDTSGGYVTIYFKDFELYGVGDSGSSLANGIMDLDKISTFYVGASASSRQATENSTSTIFVDDITAFILSITSTHLDDDFENYTDDSALAAKWDQVWTSSSGVTMSRSLSTTGGVEGSQAMQMDFSFQSGVNPITGLGVNWKPCIFGITGYYTGFDEQTDLTDYVGVSLWIKPGTITGNESYFKLNVLEDESPGTEEKWMSPKVILSDLDPNGQYVNLYFDDFTQYYTTAQTSMDKDIIKTSYLFLAYDYTATANSSARIWVDDITYVKELFVDKPGIDLPNRFNLLQNYPNPFNPLTTIRYNLPEASNVQLIIYDILGREVIQLVNERFNGGRHSIQWNGRDKYGVEVSAGVYIYRLTTRDFAQTKKLILLK